MSQENRMTPAELAQVEEAKKALRNMGAKHAKDRAVAKRTIACSAPLALRRVIELEGEIARLKEWQAKAVPYLKKEKTRIQFVDFDDGEDMPYCLKGIADITALIAQAQEGGER